MSIINLLESLQWKWEKTGNPCPDCLNGYKYGHKSDCEISRRINQLKAAEHLAKSNPDFDYKKLFISLFEE